MNCLDRFMRARYRDKHSESGHALRLWRGAFAAAPVRAAVSDSGHLFDSDHGGGSASPRQRLGDWQISCCRNVRPSACNLAPRRIIRSSMSDSSFPPSVPEIDRP
jgi:hypothetical protein